MESNTSLAGEQLSLLFDYSIWARDRLLPAIEALNEEQLRLAPGQGTYGSIFGTLVHLAASEWMWLQRCQGESPGPSPTEDEFASLRVLVDWWNSTHAAAVSYIQRLNDEDLAQEVTYRGPDNKTRTRKVWHMLLQVVNHQTEHRAQIGTMLGMLGIDVPPTDLVVYLSTNA